MVQETRKEHLARAALAVFAEKTYAGARLPDVADQAGVAVGTIYRYFPGKNELGNMAFRLSKNLLRTALFASLPANGPVVEQFEHLWRALGEFVLTEPNAFAFLELQAHDLYLDDNSRALDTEITHQIVDWVKFGQSEGAIREGNPELLIAAVLGAMTGLVKQSRSTKQPLTVDVIETAQVWVWDLIRTHPDPRS
jgi:TetR/AcrR family transcriptional regulator, repressor of fatR-cypB operon